jgi:hypothetical protein
MKVHELIELLQKAPPKAEVYIAPTPFINGWVNRPLEALGVMPTELPCGRVVIGCREETAFEEEKDINWPKGEL